MPHAPATVNAGNRPWKPPTVPKVFPNATPRVFGASAICCGPRSREGPSAAGATWDMRIAPSSSYWGSARVPTLLIYGTEDGNGTRQNAEDLARRIPGARLHFIDQAGHFVIREQPGQVLALMRAFANCLAETPTRLTGLSVRAGGKRGRRTRNGLYKGYACRKPFTATVGTIFEDSHIPLNKWLMRIYLICSSKKGIFADQLHRMLGITYKSAWFMAQRIRFAMSQQPLSEELSLGVEADETYAFSLSA